MASYLWTVVLVCLAGAMAQDLNLLDALDDPTTAPPGKVQPGKIPPKTSGDELDLSDALGPDPEPKKPAGNPAKPGGSDPKKPAGAPKSEGGTLGDSDLTDILKDFKPDPGKGGNGKAQNDDSSYDASGGSGEPKEEQSGQMAGILSAVGVAIVGAASSYFAYQKKKLCFKIQGGTDPESGVNQSGTRSEPQVLSNLLKSS